MSLKFWLTLRRGRINKKDVWGISPWKLTPAVLFLFVHFSRTAHTMPKHVLFLLSLLTPPYLLQLKTSFYCSAEKYVGSLLLHGSLVLFSILYRSQKHLIPSERKFQVLFLPFQLLRSVWNDLFLWRPFWSKSNSLLNCRILQESSNPWGNVDLLFLNNADTWTTVSGMARYILQSTWLGLCSMISLNSNYDCKAPQSHIAF